VAWLLLISEFDVGEERKRGEGILILDFVIWRQRRGERNRR
jgi:hypothetical protein